MRAFSKSRSRGLATKKSLKGETQHVSKHCLKEPEVQSSSYSSSSSDSDSSSPEPVKKAVRRKQAKEKAGHPRKEEQEQRAHRAERDAKVHKPEQEAKSRKDSRKDRKSQARGKSPRRCSREKSRARHSKRRRSYGSTAGAMPPMAFAAMPPGFPPMPSAPMGMGYSGMGMPGMNMPGMAMPTMALPGMAMPSMAAHAGYGSAGYPPPGYGMPGCSAAGYPAPGYGTPSYGYGPLPGYSPGAAGPSAAGCTADSGVSSGPSRDSHALSGSDKDRGSSVSTTRGPSLGTATSSSDRSREKVNPGAADPAPGPGRGPTTPATSVHASASAPGSVTSAGTKPLSSSSGAANDSAALAKLLGGDASAATPAKVKAMIPCRYQMREVGSCINGDSCAFSHDPDTIAKAKSSTALPSPDFKTLLCRFFGTGSCTRGAACTYAHSLEELRGGLGALAKLLPASSIPLAAALLKMKAEGLQLLGPKAVAAPKPISITPKIVAPKVISPMISALGPAVPTQSKSAGPPQPAAPAPRLVLPRAIAPKLASPPTQPRLETCKLFLQGLCWKGATCPYFHEGTLPPGLELGLAAALTSLGPGTTSVLATALCKSRGAGIIDLAASTHGLDDSSLPAPAGCQPKALPALEAPSTPAVLQMLDACAAAAGKAVPPAPPRGAAPPPLAAEPARAVAVEATARSRAPPERLPKEDMNERVGVPGDLLRVSFGWQRITARAAGGAPTSQEAAGGVLTSQEAPAAAAPLASAQEQPVNLEDL